MIRKTKNGYVVKDKAGKRTLGHHETRQQAEKQLAAIEIAKRRKKGNPYG